MGGGPGQLPYHLQCPHPPPAHLHYYYDPSCFVRVAPPQEVDAAQSGELMAASSPSDTKTQSVLDNSEASDVCTGGLTTKKETCMELSESESASAIVYTDTTGEIVHKLDTSTKSENVESGETVDLLETRPKTEVESTNVSTSMKTEVESTNVSTSMKTEVESTDVSISMKTKVESTNVSTSMTMEVESTNVSTSMKTEVESTDVSTSMKAEVVNEVAKSEHVENKQQCDVRLVSCNDKTERTSRSESSKTSAALGGLHALYEASLHVHREATTKAPTVELDATDGLQLLCSAMEQAMETSHERGERGISDHDTTSESAKPIAGPTSSTELDKNYNVPRKGSFTPMKTNLSRKDETGEWRSPAGERCRSTLKIGEQL